MKHLSVLCLGLVSGLTAAADPIPVAVPNRDTAISFENEILPILRSSCLACHSKTERQAELVLETPADILKGGDNGPAVVAGRPQDSLLLKVASHASEPVMPPQDNDVQAKNLTSDQLGLIHLWIRQGATGSGSSTLSPRQWHPLPPGIQPVLSTALSPDGQYVASARANQIFIYHVATGQLVTRLADSALDTDQTTGIAHRDLVQSLTFNRQGDMLASGGFREIKLWSRPRDVRIWEQAAAESPGDVRLSPDGKWIALSNGTPVIELRSTSDGKAIRQLSAFSEPVTGLRFTPDSSGVVASDNAGEVAIFDVASGAKTQTFSAPGQVNDVAVVSPVQQENAPLIDELQIVTAGADNIVRVWVKKAAEEGAEPVWAQAAELKGHSKPVRSLSVVSGRPAELVSGSDDGSLILWHTSGRLTRQIRHNVPLVRVAVSPDAQVFVTVPATGSPKLWRSNGQQIAELKGDLRQAAAVAAKSQQLKSAQTRLRVAKSQLDAAEKDVPNKTALEKKTQEALTKANEDVESKKKTLMDATAARTKAEADSLLAAQEVRAAQVAKDEAQVAADQAADEVKGLQSRLTSIQQASAAAPQNEELKTLQQQTQQQLQSAQQTAQQKTSAVAQPTQKLQQVTNNANTVARALDAAQKPYNDALVAFEKSEDTQNLAASRHALAATELKAAQEAVPVRKQAVTTAEQTENQLQEELKGVQETAQKADQPVLTVRFAPDGKSVLTAGQYGAIQSWSTQDGAAVQSWEGHAGSVTQLCWVSADSFLSIGADKTLRHWEVSPGWRLVRTIDESAGAPLTHRVTAVDFSPDGRRLVAASGIPSRSGELSVFQVADGKRALHLPEAHDDTIYAAKYSPDGSRIASAGADKYVRTFAAKDAKQLRRFEGHTGYVLDVAWSSDAQTLASAAADNSIKVWDVETADQRRTISTFRKHVTAVNFVGESSDVFCVTGGRVVRTIRTSNGGTARTFSGARKWLHCATLSADGTRAAVGDAAGNLYLWNVQTGQLLQQIDAKAESDGTK